MKLNWRWVGFVAVITVAVGAVFSSPVFRKYSLQLGADMHLRPSVIGILLGVLFLMIFVGSCYLATSIYGKPYQLETKPDNKKPGPGGGHKR